MNVTRERRIKKVSPDGVFCILSQLLPGIGLRDNAFRQTFRYEAAVSFFRNLKYKIVYLRISHGTFLPNVVVLLNLSQAFFDEKSVSCCENFPAATLAFMSADLPRGTLSDSHFPVVVNVRCLARNKICPT